MHPNKIKCYLEEQARENERVMETICARERAYQQAEANLHTHNEEIGRDYYHNPLDQIPINGNMEITHLQRLLGST